jgi:hypothetical protein
MKGAFAKTETVYLIQAIDVLLCLRVATENSQIVLCIKYSYPKAVELSQDPVFLGK